MKLKKNHLIITLVVAIVAALSYFGYQYWQSKLFEKAAADKPLPVKTALTVELVKPMRASINQIVSANGSIAPWQEAVIGNESNGLMLAQVLVNVGDNVKRGQLLAQFATATIAADIAQAQANLAEAKANALEAAGNASRARSIQDSGALSTQTIEQLIALEATSKARVAAAQATLQSQQIKLKQTKVVAPDNGIISGRAATVGAVVSPGQELFKLIRQSRLEWRAELTSSDISLIKNGMDANLTLPDGNIITGKVRTASPMVDSQTRNAIVFVDIPAGSAKAGMFARGTFAVGQQEAITLPAAAIVMKDGFAYVMQVGADRHIKQIKIKTGNQIDKNVAITVLDGQEISQFENSQFVAAGGAFLADGDLVAVAGEKPAISKPIGQAE